MFTAFPLASDAGAPSFGGRRGDRRVAPSRPAARCATRFSQARTWLRTRSRRPGFATADEEPRGIGHFAAADRLAGPDAYSLLLAGVAITGLLSVLLSPVGWIHHLVWIIPVIGALAGDGRDTRRRLIAAGLWLYFLFPLPWWGTRLIGPQHPLISNFFGRIIQDLFGAAALAMLWALGIWLVNRLVRDSDEDDSSHREAEVGTLAP